MNTLSLQECPIAIDKTTGEITRAAAKMKEYFSLRQQKEQIRWKITINWYHFLHLFFSVFMLLQFFMHKINILVYISMHILFTIAIVFKKLANFFILIFNFNFDI